MLFLDFWRHREFWNILPKKPDVMWYSYLGQLRYVAMVKVMLLLDYWHHGESWRVPDSCVAYYINLSNFKGVSYPADWSRIYVPCAVNAVFTGRANITVLSHCTKLGSFIDFIGMFEC